MDQLPPGRLLPDDVFVRRKRTIGKLMGKAASSPFRRYQPVGVHHVASTATPAQQARAAAHAARRRQAAERRARDARIKAEQQEQRDEQIAPAVQRLPVLNRNGAVIRGARLERDGIAFVRSNPICRMVAIGSNKEHPLLTSAMLTPPIVS
jgi:hypothetical protein